MSSFTEKKVAPLAPTKEPLMKGFQGKADDKATPRSSYEVVVSTGDIPGAETDGDVWLLMNGSKGKSQWLYLDTSKNKFERGSTDYFYFDLPDLGTLNAAWIYFRPLGDYPEWYLNNVIVNGKVFAHYGWLTTEIEVQLRSF